MKLLSRFVKENQDHLFALIDFTYYGEDADKDAIENDMAFKVNGETARLLHVGTKQECYERIDFRSNQDEYTCVVPLSVIPKNVLNRYKK